MLARILAQRSFKLTLNMTSTLKILPLLILTATLSGLCIDSHSAMNDSFNMSTDILSDLYKGITFEYESNHLSRIMLDIADYVTKLGIKTLTTTNILAETPVPTRCAISRYILEYPKTNIMRVSLMTQIRQHFFNIQSDIDQYAESSK